MWSGSRSAIGWGSREDKVKTGGWLRAKGCVHGVLQCSEYNCKDSKSVQDEHSSNICYCFCPTVNQSIYSTTCVLFLLFPFTICFHPKSSQKCQWCGTPRSQFTLPRVWISKWTHVWFLHSEAVQCSFLLLSFGIISLKSPILAQV